MLLELPKRFVGVPFQFVDAILFVLFLHGLNVLYSESMWILVFLFFANFPVKDTESLHERVLLPEGICKSPE